MMCYRTVRLDSSVRAGQIAGVASDAPSESWENAASSVDAISNFAVFLHEFAR
jgi:hypothetical protein